jgi:pyruvate/2-oxoglutarate dehydrogenase complex dihydrolipoamide acyltransferase (E2) component
MAERRAGGHIDRGDGKGWVLDDTPAEPLPSPEPHKPLSPTVEVAGGWRLAPEAPPPAPAPEPVPEPEPEPDIEVEAEAEEPEQPSDAEVRAWAKANGIDVSARGRISKDVVDQYLNREA